MKKLYLLTIAAVVASISHAQTSYYKFVNEPTIASSSFLSCLATNTGYVFAGSANNLIFDSHFFIARTSTTGALQQMRSFPSSGFNRISSVLETLDGKIAYWGTEGNSTSFVNSLALLKTDIVGNFLITKTFSSSLYSLSSTKFFQDAQENYYLLATATNTLTFQDAICLIKTDVSGNIISQKLLDLVVSTSSMDIIPTAGNGVLVTGYANNGSSIETIALFKLDANLSLSWSKWYSSPTTRYFHYDVKEKPNGNFILCGRYDDTTNPYGTLVMEIDNSGNQVWARKYQANNGSRNHGYEIQLTTSGDAVIGGGIDLNLGSGPIMAMSVNASSGSVNWSKFLNSGAVSTETIYSMQFTSGGDILACGYRDGNATMLKASSTFDVCSDSLFGITDAALTIPTQSASPTISNAVLTSGNWSKTPASFTTVADACSGVGISEKEDDLTFSAYPNPVKSTFIVTGKHSFDGIKIFDSLGKLVYEKTIQNEQEFEISTAELHSGIYQLQVWRNEKMKSIKLIKMD
ncbi:MAG: T9SS type A sorting domain-containing protein [Bacteroidetes bacterium]|nr:T9SS type A sorting domain-containing protein [Bacteroidota bacterium]